MQRDDLVSNSLSLGLIVDKRWALEPQHRSYQLRGVEARNVAWYVAGTHLLILGKWLKGIWMGV